MRPSLLELLENEKRQLFLYYFCNWNYMVLHQNGYNTFSAFLLKIDYIRTIWAWYKPSYRKFELRIISFKVTKLDMFQLYGRSRESHRVHNVLFITNTMEVFCIIIYGTIEYDWVIAMGFPRNTHRYTNRKLFYKAMLDHCVYNSMFIYIVF